ncbi:MAG: hypothetical protein AMXMBFR61_24960 [Fimbriimonadales bacterium]
MKVLVLGGTGMLGAMVTDYLSCTSDLAVHATARNSTLAESARALVPQVQWHRFDAEEVDLDLSFLTEYDWVINCIGITKPLIHDDNPKEVERAILVNSLLPHRIQAAIRTKSTRVLQIATDCVYSGAKGSYVEKDPHDAWDAYGKTKSLGETPSENYFHLRCSIIGPEPKDHKFLFDWFLGQPQGASVKGFTNHLWNGVTTLHFAKLCHGVMNSVVRLPSRQHVIPGDTLTKYELLRTFASAFGREDIQIAAAAAPTAVDRSLGTEREDINRELWAAAGYTEPPTIRHMVSELARYKLKLRWS